MKLLPNQCSLPGSTPSTSEPAHPLTTLSAQSAQSEPTYSFAVTPDLRAVNRLGEADRSMVDVTRAMGAPGNPNPAWKRCIDVVGCMVALPFLMLCTFGMYLLTKCVSPGPIFFQQERIGYMGRRFKIYKFRTMKVGSDCSVHRDYAATLISSNAPMVKLDNRGDARLFPLAWLLRASGLDELPQILNVLLGDMSLVGPRPCIPAEFEQYSRAERQRCDAVPGLTGLWQVSGKNRTTFEQMIHFDIQYSRELSFWLDLKIIFLTIPSLFQQIQDLRRAKSEGFQASPKSISTAADRIPSQSALAPTT